MPLHIWEATKKEIQKPKTCIQKYYIATHDWGVAHVHNVWGPYINPNIGKKFEGQWRSSQTIPRECKGIISEKEIK